MKSQRFYTVTSILKSSVLHVFLMSVAASCLFPLFWMIRCSLMNPQTIFTDKALIPSSISIAKYAQAWTQGDFGTFFLNSVLYTGCVVFLLVIIASLAAFAFSRLEFPGRSFFFYMFVLALMIPLPGSFVPLVVLMNKIGLANTRTGYILCMVNVGLSLSILLLKTFFDKMPHDLEDAARIDGCSKLGIWRQVALPLAMPAIAVIIIFNSLNVWNEFILAQLLLSDRSKMPLQVGLMAFQGPNSADVPLVMAGLTITTIPIVIIYLVMQKHIIKGLSSGAIVG